MGRVKRSFQTGQVDPDSSGLVANRRSASSRKMESGDIAHKMAQPSINRKLKQHPHGGYASKHLEIQVTSCANSPAALKDGGLSEVEVPEANTPICCSSSSPCSRGFYS
ncbi:hypothetical protein NE237_020243 [Protea cynaroides]|uniref:Uncharacterized protein n=1 Tax=Protea cynaroides TaxID=273540 RepID=A0A9Q0K3P5_9MAGN|nr:hypothetical protein NE237_020243 [Protea cynaroides]